MEDAEAMMLLGQINSATSDEAAQVKIIADGIAAILAKPGVPQDVADALSALAPVAADVQSHLDGIAAGFAPVPAPTPTPGG